MDKKTRQGLLYAVNSTFGEIIGLTLQIEQIWPTGDLTPLAKKILAREREDRISDLEGHLKDLGLEICSYPGIGSHDEGD